MVQSVNLNENVPKLRLPHLCTENTLFVVWINPKITVSLGQKQKQKHFYPHFAAISNNKYCDWEDWLLSIYLIKKVDVFSNN